MKASQTLNPKPQTLNCTGKIRESLVPINFKKTMFLFFAIKKSTLQESNRGSDLTLGRLGNLNHYSVFFRNFVPVFA